jgi:hypothetical protein
MSIGCRFSHGAPALAESDAVKTGLLLRLARHHQTNEGVRRPRTGFA